MIKIRKATLSDIEDINRIYNEAVEKTVSTFDTKPKTVEEQRKWFKGHGPKNPIVVAEWNGKIVGWAALSKYSDKCAYLDTSEISLYVQEDYHGKGIGRRLMEEIIREGKRVGIHAIIAKITDGNDISIHLHESMGFKYVGILKEVGFKFGKRLDVRLMEKIL